MEPDRYRKLQLLHRRGLRSDRAVYLSAVPSLQGKRDPKHEDQGGKGGSLNILTAAGG